MTEESRRRIGDAVVAPVALGVTTLAAYVHEQARAIAHTKHFGVNYVAADPRQAVIGLIALGLVAVIVLGTAWVALRAADVAVPAGLAIAVLGGAVFGVMGDSVAEGVVVLTVYVAALFVLVRVWRETSQSISDIVTAAPSTRAASLVRLLGRLRTALKPPSFLVLIGAALAILWAAWLAGGWSGRIQAEGQTTFDVVTRDQSKATVIFTRTEDIVERVLDVSPGPDGQPRNVWLPGVAIRPMPDTGIKYETVWLGRTQPAGVSRP